MLLTIQSLKKKLGTLIEHVMYDVNRSKLVSSSMKLLDPVKAGKHDKLAEQKMKLILSAALPDEIDSYALINTNMPESEYKLSDMYLGSICVANFGADTNAAHQSPSLYDQLCKDQSEDVLKLIEAIVQSDDYKEGRYLLTLIRLANVDYMNYVKSQES